MGRRNRKIMSVSQICKDVGCTDAKIKYMYGLNMFLGLSFDHPSKNVCVVGIFDFDKFPILSSVFKKSKHQVSWTSSQKDKLIVVFGNKLTTDAGNYINLSEIWTLDPGDVIQSINPSDVFIEFLVDRDKYNTLLKLLRSLQDKNILIKM